MEMESKIAATVVLMLFEDDDSLRWGMTADEIANDQCWLVNPREHGMEEAIDQLKTAGFIEHCSCCEDRLFLTADGIMAAARLVDLREQGALEEPARETA